VLLPAVKYGAQLLIPVSNWCSGDKGRLGSLSNQSPGHQQVIE
jgi:hypothetical protein